MTLRRCSISRCFYLYAVIPSQGPNFPEPLEGPESLDRLSTDIPGALESLRYVMRAITLTRHKLAGACPLFGFTGAPWTLMSYMIEGSGSPTHSKSKAWLYKYSHLCTIVFYRERFSFV